MRSETADIVTLCASLLRASKKEDPKHFNHNLDLALRACERWSEVNCARERSVPVPSSRALPGPKSATAREDRDARISVAPRRRRSWATLPGEILQLIMRAVRTKPPSDLAGDHHKGWRLGQLAVVHCAAVCRTWEAEASRALWEIVTIKSIDKMRLFALASIQCAARDPEGREGAERVRYLSIQLTDKRQQGVWQGFSSLLESMAPRLSNLAVVTINMLEAPYRLTFAALAAFFRPPSRNLVAFHFHGRLSNFQLQIPPSGPLAWDAAAIEAGLGQLKVLEFTANCADTNALMRRLFRSAGRHLRVLAGADCDLNMAEFAPEALCNLSTWIMGGKGHDRLSPSSLIHSLGARSTRLRRVDFSRCEGLTDDVVMALLRSSPLVDDVSLRGHPLVTDIPIAHLQNHHRPLVHLVLNGMRRVSEPAMTSFLTAKSSALLTLDMGRNAWVSSADVLQALGRHAHKLENLQLGCVMYPNGEFIGCDQAQTLTASILALVAALPSLGRVGFDVQYYYLDDAQRRELRDAGRIAGVDVKIEERLPVVDLLRLARVV
ncbi:hypothetical protein BDK51DRAFT_48875 [Blyttiomyces helicus]|uniref:F-box domain-containing protein n=1 Tax=Blyttiomyces helicus TaxID=388810 RepID=A0A4P9VXW4_9FUNG|nr:hypothetical protein BDK51DRAFT_48875 [Blyttiomyces helicus]|eukprot:RKO84584.1 hypothetical protein BDK51DRAFT_48875 [Blyttiomyces helicus]